MNTRKFILAVAVILLPAILIVATAFRMGFPDEKKGAFAYKDFEKASKCRTCHGAFYEQWSQS
ncbi:MAG TPA: hypothetical protein VK994_00210, partial [Bacteroidales bacterium]|nr:hypothetical protein [Bacteroidales bacterium]